MKYKIAIGVDHRGFALKNELILRLQNEITWIDTGTFTEERTDYPVYAHKVVELMLNKEVDLGILSCGTGIGIAAAANRFKGIYAGVVWNEQVARSAKEDDNVNILVLPADYLSLEESLTIITVWLQAHFKAGRYQERLMMIDSFTCKDRKFY